MKVSCEIIKDLLPLYQEKLCSDESKKLIDEHLVECAGCGEIYRRMNENVKLNDEFIKENMKEADDLMRLSKRWNKKLMLGILKGIGIGAISVLIVILILSIFVGIKIG